MPFFILFLRNVWKKINEKAVFLFFVINLQIE